MSLSAFIHELSVDASEIATMGGMLDWCLPTLEPEPRAQMCFVEGMEEDLEEQIECVAQKMSALATQLEPFQLHGNIKESCLAIGLRNGIFPLFMATYRDVEFLEVRVDMQTQLNQPKLQKGNEIVEWHVLRRDVLASITDLIIELHRMRGMLEELEAEKRVLAARAKRQRITGISFEQKLPSLALVLA